MSIAYTFDKANATASSTRRSQYFEMMGVCAIYNDGWIASTTPIRPPWELTGAVVEDPATAYKWELYDLTKDWTQDNDLASSNPAKLRELQELLWTELANHQALPLDASVATRLVAPRPNLAAGRTRFTYSGELTGIPHGDAPNVLDTSYIITAEVEIPQLSRERRGLSHHRSQILKEYRYVTDAQTRPRRRRDDEHEFMRKIRCSLLIFIGRSIAAKRSSGTALSSSPARAPCSRPVSTSIIIFRCSRAAHWRNSMRGSVPTAPPICAFSPIRGRPWRQLAVRQRVDHGIRLRSSNCGDGALQFALNEVPIGIPLPAVRSSSTP